MIAGVAISALSCTETSVEVGSKNAPSAEDSKNAMSTSNADGNIVAYDTPHCELRYQTGQVYYWKLKQVSNGKTSLLTLAETVLAQRDNLTLRLSVEVRSNGAQDVGNTVYYGPLYLGDLEDFRILDQVYNQQTLTHRFPSTSRLMDSLESDIRSDTVLADMIEAFDRIWEGRVPDSEDYFDFFRFREEFRLRADITVDQSMDSSTHVPVWVFDRIRTFEPGGTETRRTWIRKDNCIELRKSVILDWFERIDTYTQTLQRIE